ncbi:MAG TPA: cyclopropane fatty acyl phospholipid synthase [Legionella sp.]|nr:cyclopropane fatty acyl phospholipid synthase [Legionella sp.]
MLSKPQMSEQLVTDLLVLADIEVNGDEPWDIQIHNRDFYNRIIRDAELGFAESYMEGWWDCERLDLLIEKLARANVEDKISKNFWFALQILYTRFFNMQTKSRSRQVGIQHYDLGNDLYKKMLDKRMNYTCAYWKDADNLDDAQLAKLDLCCRKLKLEPGMRVLDIGCGWGALAQYAAEQYKVSVVGITISEEQCKFAQERCKNLPVEIRLQDYRDVVGQFDRVVSLGMFEHVGHLNYRTYMELVHRCLIDNGIFLLHTIGGNVSTTHASQWLSKYIFPNGMIPSIAQIGKASEKLLIMEDWQNFGLDYNKTLLAWHKNFNAHWDELKDKYDQRFFRMWNYYLLWSAGGFKAREVQLWQIVFSKERVEWRYDAPR